jgi:hypothetical protein
LTSVYMGARGSTLFIDRQRWSNGLAPGLLSGSVRIDFSTVIMCGPQDRSILPRAAVFSSNPSHFAPFSLFRSILLKVVTNEIWRGGK